MIAFNGVPELVRHVRQELRLVAARRLELSVQPPELVVHLVHVRCERTQLVAIADLDVSGKVAGCDRGQARVDPLDRPDQRPREHETEQQRERDRARCHADEQVPRAHVRSRVLSDQAVRFRSRRLGEHGAELVEVDREQLGVGAEAQRSITRCRPAFGLDDAPHHGRETPALRADPPKDAFVLGRRHESEPVGECRSSDPRQLVHDGEVDGDRRPAARRPADVDLVVVRPDVLGEEAANRSGVALELPVGGRLLLESAECPHPGVRLAENAQPEQGDRDDQHGGSDEPHEELRVHVRRHAGDRADKRVVAAAQRPPSFAPGNRSLRSFPLGQRLKVAAALTLRPCW
jgi:hypothetical protein